MSTPPRPTQDLDELLTLAKRFSEQKLYEEALDLFGLALRLDPRNRGIQLAIAQLRKQQKQDWQRPKNDVDQEREEIRRNSIDAAHFLGLAHLFHEKGEDFRALECLEIAQAKDLAHPGHHKLTGRIYQKLLDYDNAAEHLQKARRFNPFDREVAEALGQVQFERKQFEEALGCTIDAFLLSNEGDAERSDRLRRRIRTIKQMLGWDTGSVVRMFHDRQQALHTAFDRLEWRRERFHIEESQLEASAAAPVKPVAAGTGRLDLAARLRKVETFAHLTDEQVFEVTLAVSEESFERGAKVFASGTQGTDLYLVEKGEVAIQRPTAYGTFPLAVLKAGALFGEVNYLTHSQRSGDATAAQRTTLLRFDAVELERLVRQSAELGVQIYWGLWHALAQKLRSTNEQLRTFFAADAQPENFLRLRRGPRPGGAGPVQVDSSDKIRLFREQGLSGRELETLAAFSKERRFADGEVLFQEGERGNEMYVVLEGKVLISKFIPGAGEEALAILERGDFFGEMSLIDGQARSADAKAHGGQVTVLALDQSTIQEMLALDPQAALEFLQLLCRLVAKRLREIDEKVVTWRILSGERSLEVSA